MSLKIDDPFFATYAESFMDKLEAYAELLANDDKITEVGANRIRDFVVFLYVIYRKHGNTLDKFGNIVDPSSEAVHIPFNEFTYN